MGTGGIKWKHIPNRAVVEEGPPHPNDIWDTDSVPGTQHFTCSVAFSSHRDPLREVMPSSYFTVEDAQAQRG